MTRSIDPLEARSKEDSAPEIHVQILHVRDCPLVGGLRNVLHRCLSRSGLCATIEEVEGPYPSPTLLIDGLDPTGRPIAAGASCRLDLATEGETLAALKRAEAQRTRLSPGDEDERCA